MTVRELVIEHDIDLAPAIVWDALVDPVLVSGWLGEARIDPVLGGSYELSWLGSPEFPSVDGRITALSEPTAITVRTATHGEFGFTLHPHSGGSRGTWTRLILTVTLEVEDAFAARVESNWRGALVQLDELLRGHPVLWQASPPTLTGTAASWDTQRG